MLPVIATACAPFVFNLGLSLIDNKVLDNVKPQIGSVLTCELIFGVADHSGIYIGNNKIVHLDGDGQVKIITPKQFLKRLGGFNTAISIYVGCDDNASALGRKKIANRAKKMVGKYYNYRLFSKNCHMFTSGCITGNFKNTDIFQRSLSATAHDHLAVKKWRVWATK